MMRSCSCRNESRLRWRLAALSGWLVALVFVLSPASAWPQAANPQEARLVSKQALSFYKTGKFVVAAELYHRAYKLDPSRPQFLYGAARAEHKAGRLEQAALVYKAVKKALGPKHDLYRKSQRYLFSIEDEIRDRQSAQARPPKIQTKRPKTPQPARPAGTTASSGDRTVGAPAAVATSGSTWRRPVGWICAGLGLVAAGAGAAVGMNAIDRREKLDAKRDPVSNKFNSSMIAPEVAIKEDKDINSQIVTAYVVGIGGVAVTALGAYWVMTAADAAPTVAVLPQPRGAMVVMRF